MLEGFVSLAAASAAYFLTPLVMKLMKIIGHTRPDVHKSGKPQVPYSGGVALYASATPVLIAAALLRPESALRIAVLLAASTTAFLVGLIDDFKVLGGRTKTLLTILTVAPIVVAHLIKPDAVPLGRPLVPILGRLRLTLLYWLLLPLVAAGPANVVNMLDVFNGVMPATTLAATLSMILASMVIGSSDGLLLLAPLAGSLVGYLPYNKWPARILNGDAGSLFVGAYIGAAASLLQLEYVAAVALIPHILNGALIIISVGGFKEHREMRKRPVTILPDYRLAASSDPEAPLSLVRLILTIEGPLREQDVVKRIIALSVLSCAIAFLSSLLIPRS